MDLVPAKRRKLTNSPTKCNPFGKLYPKYRTIEDRIESYKSWPIPEVQKPEDLAKAGFFYEGKDDQVRCFTCGGAHTNWEDHEDPSVEHAKYFPTCSFIIEEKGKDFVANVKLMMEKKNFTVEARLSTYNECWPSTVPKTPEELATAGFFHITGSCDETQCYECGVRIKNWKVNDEVWFKHAKSNPSCKFVSDAKGSEFVAKVKQTAPPDEEIYEKNAAEHERNLDSPIYSEYTIVEKRLASFNNWPIPEVMKPKELAEVGFFYTGRDDQVSCFHCGGSHFDWQIIEDPSKVHARWYPTCSSIRRIKGARFIEGIKKTLREVYWTEGARKESFKYWPNSANKTPEELYKAGFFSTENDDQVQCFDCGFWFMDWKIYDDPWFIHAVLNPSCKFLNQMRGEIFVNQAKKAKYATGREIIFRNRKKNSTSDESSVTDADEDDEEFHTLMKSSTIQTALNLGFDEGRISTALRNHLKSHKEFKNVEELLAVVIDSHKEDHKLSARLRDRKQDNEWLKANQMCDICKKKQGPIILHIPCGHLLSFCFCVRSNLEHCFDCQEKVEHRLELFP